jgi:hypothetical protein
MEVGFWTRSVISIAIFLGAFFFQALPMGGPCYADDNGVGNFDEQEYTSRMDLTPRQKQEIIKSQRKQKDQLSRIRMALKKARGALLDELAKDKPKMGKVNSIVGTIKKLQAELIDNRVKHFLVLKKVLSRDQMRDLIDQYGKKNN